MKQYNPGNSEGNNNEYVLHGSVLKGVNISKVTKWSTYFNSTNWDGVIGLNSNNTPFKGDLSILINAKDDKGQNIKREKFEIYNSNLKGVDVSQVTKWPRKLIGINWEGVSGLTVKNTPFKGDMEDGDERASIEHSNLKGIDLSRVTAWPVNLNFVNFEGTTGIYEANTPFKGNISRQLKNGIWHEIKYIRGINLKGINVSKITHWPIDLRNIKWAGVICDLDLTSKPENWSYEAWERVKEAKKT